MFTKLSFDSLLTVGYAAGAIASMLCAVIAVL
jgi:hypothetical protein